jgi:acyl dehydratase
VHILTLQVAHLQIEDTAAISLWLRQCALPKELVAHEVVEGEPSILHVDEHAARRAADAANALNSVEEALGPVLLPGLVTAVSGLKSCRTLCCCATEPAVYVAFLSTDGLGRMGCLHVGN